MRALSVRNPWAWLIVRPDIVGEEVRRQAYLDGLIKDIENRTWPTKYRGRVLVHASKGMTRNEYDDALATAMHAGHRSYFPRREELDRGGIVGAVTIVDCIHPSARKSQWHMGSQFGFQLADAKPLPFTPCKGALGFFDVPEDVAETLRQIHAKATP